MATMLKIKLPVANRKRELKIGDIDVLELDGKNAGKVEIVDINGDWVTFKILEEDKYNTAVGDELY